MNLYQLAVESISISAPAAPFGDALIFLSYTNRGLSIFAFVQSIYISDMKATDLTVKVGTTALIESSL